MKRASAAILGLSVVVLAVTARGDGTAPPQPSVPIPAVGTRIEAANANQYASLIPGALMFAIAHGLIVNVVASRRIDWPADFRRATEKYSAQVSLNANGVIQNYVAGLPFPEIGPDDSNAGTKIAYNWRFGPFLPRDLTLAGDQKTRAYSIDRADEQRLVDDDTQRDYRNENNCEQIAMLRFGDAQTNGSNAVEWKERGDECGPDRAAVITVRYSDPVKEDESWGWLPALRKWRQFSTPGGYPNQSCTYSCTQVFFEYLPPKSEVYSARLIRTQPELACIQSRTAATGVIDVDGKGRFGELDCEVRPVYVLDLKPRRATPERTLPIRVHIDSETFAYMSGEFFRDTEHQPDTDLAIWRIQDPSAGDTLILANDFYVTGDRNDFFLALDVDAEQPAVDKNSVSKVVFNPRAQIYSDGRM